MRLNVTVTGAEQAAQYLHNFAENSVETHAFFRDVANRIFADTRRYWSGAPWKPLADSTVKAKRRRGQPSTPLKATGTLERALTVWGAPGQKLVVSNNRLEIGLDADGVASYGLFHQQGKGVPQRKIRRRLSPATRSDIREALHDHLFRR